MFELGQLVITIGISEAIKENSKLSNEINIALQRYIQMDWGEIDLEDAKTNDYSVANGERIVAAYETSSGKIWIITEWDRSATTILFPDEY